MPHFRRRRYARKKPLVDSSVTLDSHCACAQTEYLRETSASAPPVGTRIATAPGIANKTCNLEANLPLIPGHIHGVSAYKCE
jgi:hypothetical protein